MATAELVEAGLIEVQLGELLEVGNGANGTRLVIEVKDVTVSGDKVNASLAIRDAADWGTVSQDGTLLSLDVRFTLKTDDGEYIYVEYTGRGDLTNGTLAAAPTFQTGSEKYSWINRIQGVISGQVNMETGKLVYRLYEVKVTAEEGLV
ncbi:MAG: hypothetical protein CL887_07450 [Dehalococcoidia bacterium]|nr:hypothetical protein [Dehalococcoidia bacterium]|tara:strand:+ start:852 stop:1298 length:447 start_codon:yes stop_codon:yes gene_type:complete